MNIILFDGVCNLCNNSVKFVIKNDKLNKFKFASLQSTSGQSLLLKHNLPLTTFESFVLIKGDIVYTNSDAVLHLLKDLGGVWKLLYAFTIFPKSWRDLVYNLIAKNRYKIFGQQDSCMLPSKEIMDKFI